MHDKTLSTPKAKINYDVTRTSASTARHNPKLAAMFLGLDSLTAWTSKGDPPPDAAFDRCESPVWLDFAAVLLLVLLLSIANAEVAAAAVDLLFCTDVGGGAEETASDVTELLDSTVDVARVVELAAGGGGAEVSMMIPLEVPAAP